MGFVAPKFSLLSFAPHLPHFQHEWENVLQGAQNVVISGGTFNNADTVCEALDVSYHKLIK